MTTSNSSSKNGPNTLADRALKAWHDGGIIVVRFASGHEPKLDEDLSWAGILDGRYGQHQPAGNR